MFLIPLCNIYILFIKSAKGTSQYYLIYFTLYPAKIYFVRITSSRAPQSHLVLGLENHLRGGTFEPI